MRKPGKKCKERDAYHHWNHSDEQERYFFKVMTDDFSERLGIPDKFVQHFRGRIAKTVKLESRTGCTFNVEVTKSLGKVVLQTGWKAFVCAHDLKMGDFLVFRYDGTSRLKVWIFDLSCCEKMPPCHVMRSPIRGGGKGEEQIEISRSCDDLPMESTEIKSKAWKQREGSMNLNTSSTSSSDSSGDSLSPEDQKSHSVPSYILPQRTYLTCVQKKKLKERVRAICSKTPIYGCVMKKSSIDAKPQTMVNQEALFLDWTYQENMLMYIFHSRTKHCCFNIVERVGKWGVALIFTKAIPEPKGFRKDGNSLLVTTICSWEISASSSYWKTRSTR
ncbi:hypothetical protein SETIT_9G166400v2 [Setaria italica]|uniref:TF-B3 domain-containing protein n=1 Tax=Setaria italica TaxID=4555 RepID=A0A368SHC7_SETIT|nr:putative B3 domain-containing protein Os03g0621600 isoform X1 [Setaria italica]RCV41835.1 hypothetical protein SETIT_9G166400v2 [Setaria italica]